MNANVNYVGVLNLLRQLVEAGAITAAEGKKNRPAHCYKNRSKHCHSCGFFLDIVVNKQGAK